MRGETSGLSPTSVPSTDDNDRRSIVLCLDGTAEIMPEDSSGPISQQVCELGRECGESQSVRQPASRVSPPRQPQQDTSRFPSIIITTIPVHTRHWQVVQPT